jgi:CoA binding domain
VKPPAAPSKKATRNICCHPMPSSLLVSAILFALLLPCDSMVFQNSEATIRKVLLESQTIAVVGASPKPVRPSHEVMGFLLDSGYRVVPVNPGQAGGTIHGQPVFARLVQMPGAWSTMRSELVPKAFGYKWASLTRKRRSAHRKLD